MLLLTQDYNIIAYFHQKVVKFLSSGLNGRALTDDNEGYFYK